MTKPSITTRRAAGIFKEVVSIRRMYCADNDFFRMPDFWEDLCKGSRTWSIKTYSFGDEDDLRRRAGVTALGDNVTLIADELLLENACRGCLFSNFVLAHEIGHLACGHHLQSTAMRNFRLAEEQAVLSNRPPTLEEVEANYAAVFLQCGVALFDPRWSALRLAERAFSDVRWVGKSQAVVRLDVFQRELHRIGQPHQRVIL